ncbi:PLDc N-terminal domain-containing protein [Corynebacterium pseudodiphtheriticum]|uniref:PLDc N-terminal domain-containing protein n=1 Tax=Corynebacterium pseudodiphtheriticum TaxID=37637 RepID=UPI00254AE30D|nr:PLDc N-terminal domain-containing protein [Corynebacterium pseudodiphtheriticum]MDK8718782.1 PLDc N-terminal domain-containing protein [Corynebacterium pseudodiphtheriticum]
MITLYDFATTTVMLAIFLLWVISIIVLFKKKMSALSALIWLAVIIILPILGPIAFLLYSTQQKRHEGESPTRYESDTLEEKNFLLGGR